jgi:threonine-phosphate decarboxylase
MFASTELPSHGGQLHGIAKRFGVPASRLIDFSANINPEGPPPGVAEAIRSCLKDVRTLADYPDLEQAELRQALADHASLTPGQVVVANGFVPILEATLRVLSIRTCSLPLPAFNEYQKALDRADIQVMPHFLTPESNFAYDLDFFLAGKPDAVLLANPQNPSGVVFSRGRMLDLVAKAAARGTRVLLDEAFIDYAPEASIASHVDEFPNLLVFRSVTKFYGIAGLRVAYAAANPKAASLLREGLLPWAITTLAEHGVIAALKDIAYAQRSRYLNEQRRTALRDKLRTLELHTYPGAANFLLIRLPAKIQPMEFWQRMILEHGIVLRSCANYEGLAAGHFRFAVRKEADNAKLVDALARHASA